MTLLDPWTAILAASAAVPLLLLLYVLKLRRRTLRLSSTILWRRATHDLQANVPFQRLRPSWLLLLQLLLVVLRVGALGRPALQARGRPAGRVILLIDRSASMSARDAAGGSTRLDAAKGAAREIVARLLRRQEPGAVMVAAFARIPQIVIGFEHNRRLLLEAIDSIEPTDETADLDAALTLAGAFASRDEGAERRPEVVLISDGGVQPPADPRGFFLGAGELRFVGVGPGGDRPADNVGITAFSARRDYEDPSRVLVFARLVNAGPQPVRTTATLRIDGEPAEVRTVSLAGASEDLAEAPASFSLPLPRGAVLTLSIGRADTLPADDTAALVLRPPAAPRIALIHPPSGPDEFLAGLLAALEPARLIRIAAPQVAGGPPPVSPGEFDLVIFDRVAPQRLPDEPSLTFGAVPAGTEARPPAAPGGRRVLSWDRHHPLLRHVSLDSLAYTGFGALVPPSGAQGLAWGPDGPVIAVVPARAARHVVVGFDLARSNWPVDVSFAVFVQNAIDYLTLGGAAAPMAAASPGEPVAVRARPGLSAIRVQGPVAAEVQAPPGGGELTLPGLRLAGLYAVEGAEPPLDRLAVNLASDVESDIRPRSALTINAARAEAGEAAAAAPLELWPALAAAAIVVLLAEFVLYCVRMRR